MDQADTLEKIVLLIVGGLSRAEVSRAAVEKLGVTHEEAELLVSRAADSIRQAASFNREHEIGTAIHRLNDIYTRSVREKDTRTAMAAQRELNRLMRLYDPPPADEQGNDGRESIEELGIVRSHLLPLGLAPDTYPIHEHARLAAQIVRSQKVSDGHSLRSTP